MASYFEELGAFDRPYVDVLVKVGGKFVPLLARLPSAMEQDAMDAFFQNGYAQSLADMSKPGVDKPCELDTVRSIYASRPASDLITQLMGTRRQDVTARALELCGLSLEGTADKLRAMSEGEEKAAYEAEVNAKIEGAMEQARAEIRSEYDSVSHEELVHKTSQVAINIKALGKTNRALGSHYIYYTLFRPGDNPTRAFESATQVQTEFSPETIEAVVKAVREAIEVEADLPPASPEGNAPDGHSSSPSTSAVDTATSGEHIEMTPAV